MKTKLLLLLPLGIALLTPVRAQLNLTISADIYLGKAPPPPPPEVIVIVETGPVAPPPWTPPPGVSLNRDYYYYPGTNVYYRPADRIWFYLDGSNWRFGVTLPTSFRVDFDRSVTLTMATDQPYQFHDRVQVRYPSDYFTTKVRVKERGNSEKAKADHAGKDDDSHGKGKGKDKGKGNDK